MRARATSSNPTKIKGILERRTLTQRFQLYLPTGEYIRFPYYEMFFSNTDYHGKTF